jgi:hypothetical protein
MISWHEFRKLNKGKYNRKGMSIAYKNQKYQNYVKTLLNGQSELGKMMKKYVATPFCDCGNDGKWIDCKKCDPPIPVQKYPVQSHGGNLFEHSQWSSLYLLQWYHSSDKYKILSQLMYKVVNSSFVQSIAGKNNIELIILSGFLHDIGKGGDRIFDMYHKQKYNGEGDTAHPKFCMDLLLDPGKSYNHQLSTELNQIMALFKNPKICKLVLAVCAATHWEFGKLNKPLQYGGIQPKKYLNIIQNKLHIIKDRLDIEVITEDSFRTIVDICMLVSCSDIISSYNTELDKSLLSNLGFEMAEMKHRSEGGAWTKFKMNINHINLIKQVHTELEE